NYVPYWAAAQLAFMIGLVVVKTRRLAGKVRLVLPPSLALYLLTGAAMGAIVYLVGYVALPSGIGSLDYGVRLLVIVAAGTVFYFGVLSILDKKVRRLVRSVIGMLMRTEAASTPVAGSGSITP
ncbi:MAG TPA: hypothetical protein VLY21_00020, partial [Nitrososphaerales archaeon]|nr:hypothetical protein [Nitrososphaerales archaeon]